MKKNLLFLLILIFSSLSLSDTSLAQTRSLTLIFSGDTRGEIENCHCPKEDFGGLERRAVYIDSVRKEKDEILLVDVGDVLPLKVPDLSEDMLRSIGEVSFKAMEIMRYDVMNIGESDLVLGKDFIEEKAGLNFDLVSANIVSKETQELIFKPYKIKVMKNGLRVGILGTINERYVINEELDIKKNKESVLSFLPDLKRDSDIIIVLGHLGLPYSLELANSVEGIDIILNGHWDTDSQEPIKIKETIIMPTTYKSRRIGRLDLEINGNKKITSYTWQSTVLDARYEGNEEIKNLVESIKEKAEEPQSETEAVSPSKLNVYIFQSPECKECIKLSRTVLAAIKEKYKDRLNIEEFDTTNPATYEKMVKFEKIYNVRGGIVPEVFFGRHVLIGAKQIRMNLDKMIEKTLASGNFDIPLSPEVIPEPYQPPGSLILERFKSFSFYTVGIAGLLDGINPCAFTTLVFFISFLGFTGYRRREVVWAGSSFAFAVFITYLLLGLGIFKTIKSLRVFSSIALTLNIIIAFLAILLGILNLYDYYKIRKTKDPTSMFLKLPQSIKASIHSVIGKDFRNRERLRGSFLKLLPLGLLTGFLISILESICTGQVYLPTIAFVTRMTDFWSSGFLYLVIYNFAFIIPLLVVFAFALFGTTSVQFAKFLERHITGAKLGTAFLFFVLGSILLIIR